LTSTAPQNINWQRGLSRAYERVGSALQAKGDRVAALASYRAALATAERLAAVDVTNQKWQMDMVQYNHDLAVNGDDPAKRFAFIASVLRAAKSERKLADYESTWLIEAEAELAKLGGDQSR
jgi:hypothetical protein